MYSRNLVPAHPWFWGTRLERVYLPLWQACFSSPRLSLQQTTSPNVDPAAEGGLPSSFCCWGWLAGVGESGSGENWLVSPGLVYWLRPRGLGISDNCSLARSMIEGSSSWKSGYNGMAIAMNREERRKRAWMFILQINWWASGRATRPLFRGGEVFELRVVIIK